jgi:hypothetical protein
LLPRLVCGGTAIVFTVHNECDVNILTSLKSKKNFQNSAEIPFEIDSREYLPFYPEKVDMG